MVRYRLNVNFASAVLVVVAVVASFVIRSVMSAASRPIGWFVACSVVALLVYPIADFFDRRLPRVLAVGLAVLLVALVLGGIWAGTASTLARNAAKLKENAPAAATELEQRYQLAADFELQRRVNNLVDDVNARIGPRAAVQRAAGTAPTYVVTGVLMLFLLIFGKRFVDGGLAQIDDEARRERARAAIYQSAVRGRTYLLLAIAEIIAVTLACWLVFTLLNLSASFALGLVVGILSVVPSMGILLGGLPALLVAIGLEGRGAAVAVLVFVLTLQLLDTLLVRDRVERKSLHVGPALIVIVGLVGWTLYGFGGAIYGAALLVLLLAFAQAVSTEADDADVISPAPPGEDPPAAPASG
jgi:predicted PurR-regulated permease PerM